MANGGWCADRRQRRGERPVHDRHAVVHLGPDAGQHGRVPVVAQDVALGNASDGLNQVRHLGKDAVPHDATGGFLCVLRQFVEPLAGGVVDGCHAVLLGQRVSERFVVEKPEVCLLHDVRQGGLELLDVALLDVR